MAQALNIPHAGGALVASLELGSNLMAGAIQPGDVISAVDGKPVLDPRDLARKAVRVPVGSNVRLTLWRGGKEMTVSVPILPLEGAVRTGSADAGRKPVLGLRFTSVTGSARAARLDFVDPIGTAADSGLMKGDLILQVRQTPVWTSDQVMKALQDRIDQKEPFTALLVQRDGKTWWVPVALPN
jgi:serine protease Do